MRGLLGGFLRYNHNMWKAIIVHILQKKQMLMSNFQYSIADSGES